MIIPDSAANVSLAGIYSVDVDGYTTVSVNVSYFEISGDLKQSVAY